VIFLKIQDYLSQNFGYRTNENSLAQWHQKFREWESWYIGYNRDFHDYTVYNGKSRIRCRRLSMQLAKKCCEDWADILFNINCKISVKQDKSTLQLNKLLSDNNFWFIVNQAIEKSFALGTGALVLSIADLMYNEDTGILDASQAQPKIKFISADKIFPISWDNDKITECAFCSTRRIKGNQFVMLSVHYLQNNGNYAIHNRIFRMQNGEISELDEQTELNMLDSLRDFDTGNSKRWFSLISPAIANNIVTADSEEAVIPYGISVFANAIDSIKASDKAFDSLTNEIDMGRKRIFARSGILGKDADGNPVFDSNDISVYMLPDKLSKDDLIQPENSELRTAQICEALKTDLSIFSNNVGMGKDMYSSDIANMSTAAQVYSTNSELKRKRDKHKTKLENELYDLIDALCYAANTFSTYNINPEGLSIKFDDSIFEDIDTKAKRKMNEVNSELAPPYEYRTEIYDEDEETAKSKINEALEYKNQEIRLLSQPEEM